MHPLHHIVIGVDGSDASQHALNWVLEQPGLSRVEAVHAFPLATELFAGIVQINLDHERAERQRLLEGSWIEAAAGTDVHISCHLRDDNPARALLAESELLTGSSAIVVGHRHDAGHDNRRVGDVTARLLHDADTPVIVIPSSVPTRPLGGAIALCVHGYTDLGHPAVQWAARLAEAEEMSINIVDVMEPIPIGIGFGYGAGAYALSPEEVRTTKTTSLLELAAALRETHPDIVVNSVMEIGHPTTKLAQVIASTNPALVVIGNHHHTKLISMITDAVSLHLPSVVDCPVAAIPIP